MPLARVLPFSVCLPKKRRLGHAYEPDLTLWAFSPHGPFQTVEELASSPLMQPLDDGLRFTMVRVLCTSRRMVRGFREAIAGIARRGARKGVVMAARGSPFGCVPLECRYGPPLPVGLVVVSGRRPVWKHAVLPELCASVVSCSWPRQVPIHRVQHVRVQQGGQEERCLRARGNTGPVCGARIAWKAHNSHL